MSVIESVYAREVLDSRGNPTVEVEVVLVACLWVKARRYREKKQKHKTRKFTVATSVVQVSTCSANYSPAPVDYSESLRSYYFYFV